MNEDGLCLEEGEGSDSDPATGDDGGEGEGEGEDSGADSGGDDTAGPDDADGDGYSSPEDCDDADADVSPGASEVCGNGVDDDCDGSAGACGWSGETELPGDAITIRGENQYDTFGWRVEAGGDLNGDGAAADADATISGESAEQQAGYDVAMLGDADGDGYDEIALSELAHDSRTYTYQGGVAVLHGPVDGERACRTSIPGRPRRTGIARDATSRAWATSRATARTTCSSGRGRAASTRTMRARPTS